jgi:lysozyme
MAMKLGPRGNALIREFESCKLHAYPDRGGVLTQGWGATGAGVHAGTTWTQEQADARLAADEDRTAAGVSNLVQPSTTPAQFSALVVFAFNVGVSALSHSHLLMFHRAGNFRRAGDAFLAWDHDDGVVVPGLLRRRYAERALYLLGETA